MDYDFLISTLKNIIRVGLVSSIDAEKCTAKVVFHEKDDLVSHDMPVIQRQTLKNKDYQMPDIGEHVLCLCLPNGLEQGFIIGSLYSKADVPPVINKDKRHIKFEDGTTIEYDRKSHTLTVNMQSGTANITAPTINVVGNVNIDGNLTISGTTITGGSINLNTHTHPESIGSVTGSPQ